MSRLEELITELCPNGVEYKTLSTIFNTRNGYTPSKANKEFWENGTVPWFRMEDIRENGRILSRATQMVSRSAVKGELFPANSIIVVTSATIGEHALITVPSLANQRFTYSVLKAEYQHLFNIKFLFYYCFNLDQYCKECLNQGNFASVDMKKFAKFRFPIPPLPVQSEIVKILDNFTELTARKKQYEYYRKVVLRSSKTTTPKTLGEICNFVRGPFGGSLKKENFTKEGYAVYEQQHAIYGEFKFRYFVDKAKYDGMQRFSVKPGDLIMSCSGTMGKISIIPDNAPNGIINQALLKLTPKAGVNNKYLKYCFEDTIAAQMKSEARGGAIKNVASVAVLKDIKIQIPSLAEQNRIVNILDYFYDLCNNLTSGLPAEIAARQKQYEYYRDKLLTFKEMTA